MDDLGGLPYDDSAAAAAPDVAPTTTEVDGDHPMLDRALDDYPMGGEERKREPVPEHVQSLIGRMGRGKVYLAEESPGIIHHDAERRISRDPRLRRLALELDKQDPQPWLDAISETSPSPIRGNALFVESELVKHLSTAKVFTWASEFGAGVMGIEWLNDSTFILLFPTPAAALLSLSMLAKAGFDPTEGDDPLMERAAHAFPPSLLPRAETPEREAPSQRGAELVGGDDDAPKVKGRGAIRASAEGSFDLPPLAPAKDDRKFAEGVDPHARVTVRYAMESDNERRRGASESKWYQRHGRGAGKETGPRRGGPDRGRWEEPLPLHDRVGSSGEGREFARRIGRERRAPYDRERQDRPRRRANAEDLDAELEMMRSGGGDGGSRNRSRSPRRRGGREGRDRGRARQEDLDRELDDLYAARREA